VNLSIFILGIFLSAPTRVYPAAPADNPVRKVLSGRSRPPGRGGSPCLFAMCDDCDVLTLTKRCSKESF